MTCTIEAGAAAEIGGAADIGGTSQIGGAAQIGAAVEIGGIADIGGAAQIGGLGGAATSLLSAHRTLTRPGITKPVSFIARLVSCTPPHGRW